MTIARFGRGQPFRRVFRGGKRRSNGAKGSPDRVVKKREPIAQGRRCGWTTVSRTSRRARTKTAPSKHPRALAKLGRDAFANEIFTQKNGAWTKFVEMRYERRGQAQIPRLDAPNDMDNILSI